MPLCPKSTTRAVDPSILDGIRRGGVAADLAVSRQHRPLPIELAGSQPFVQPGPGGHDGAQPRYTGQPIGTPLHNLAIAANGYLSFDNVLAGAVGSGFVRTG